MARAMTQPEYRQADASRAEVILERIADTLRLPVTAFSPAEPEPSEAAQAADLVAAFMAIETVAARRTCLAFVRAMARP